VRLKWSRVFGKGKFVREGKFGWGRILLGSVEITRNKQSDLCEILESTWASIGASAESCIKFENVLLVRVGIPWLKDGLYKGRNSAEIASSVCVCVWKHE
jgi:hypothetical protein